MNTKYIIIYIQYAVSLYIFSTYIISLLYYYPNTKPQSSCKTSDKSLHFFSLFFWLHLAPWELSVPQPETEPVPLPWEHRILTTGRPGESHFTSLQASISSLAKLGNHFRVLPLFSSPRLIPKAC